MTWNDLFGVRLACTYSLFALSIDISVPLPCLLCSNAVDVMIDFFLMIN